MKGFIAILFCGLMLFSLISFAQTNSASIKQNTEIIKIIQDYEKNFKDTFIGKYLEINIGTTNLSPRLKNALLTDMTMQNLLNSNRVRSIYNQFFTIKNLMGYPHWMLEDFAERGADAHGDMNQLRRWASVIPIKTMRNRIEKEWVKTLNQDREKENKPLINSLPDLPKYIPPKN